ncbi:hypothetical protein PIB30_057986 [Stylosanthes scabra]|uniref:TraB family protein n=1 Tax=Stylosanthes scabra TaxID=79078 RepID=A0ABU6UJ96_9FABA|nr:hypothetical protein [Stylosanthes scabra]
MRKCSTFPSSEKKLMTGLPEHIVPLKLGFRHVYLVGTHHKSQKSVVDVQRMIRALKPDVVFLELYKERRGMLRHLQDPSIFSYISKELENMDMDTLNRFLEGLSKEEPIWSETMIHELDIFMAKGILNVAKKSRCVVAVVGKGHLDGIKKHLQHQQKLDDLSVDDFLTTPPPSVA